MLTEIDPHQIQDDKSRAVVMELLNLIEALKSENSALRAEVQRLRDENNRLKGEQGQPDIKPNRAKKKQDHSSEKERRQPQKWHKGRKVNQIEIDREERLGVEKQALPGDAQFKGCEAVVVQDLLLKTDKVRFWKEKYYAPSTGQSYLAALPSGYEGEFGPGLRALVISLYYAGEMTEPKIIEFLSHFKISVSAGQVSNWLSQKNDLWQGEKDEIYQAGLTSSSWQHLDDTATRVDGQNYHCHVLANPLYPAYFTWPRKDRLTLIEILQNASASRFLLNDQTGEGLATFALPQWVHQTAGRLQSRLGDQSESETGVGLTLLGPARHR